jgi:hypothetical protein
VVIRKIGGVLLLLFGLVMLAGPVSLLIWGSGMHTVGFGREMVGVVAYQVTAGAMALLAGLYLLTGGKNKKV